MRNKAILATVACMGLVLASIVSAQSKVVVIPLAGDDLSPLANIVSVAKQNGDFDDPVDAINSILDAGASKPYLVVVAPGVYDLSNTITLKPFVSLVGSGIDTTVLKGSFRGVNASSPLSSLLSMASNTSVANMTIENNGEGIIGTAVAVRVQNVTQNVHIRDLKTLAIGANFCHGIAIDDATVDINRVESNAIACGTVNGIFASNGSQVRVDNSRLIGTGGNFSRGIAIGSASDFEIRHSYLLGSTGVDFGFAISAGSTARISHSSLGGGIASSGAGAYSCVFTDDTQGNALDSSCN